MPKFIPIANPDLAVAIGRRLKSCRQKEGLTMDQVATKADVSRRAYLEWERGRKLPRLDSLVSLCNLYELEVDGLLADLR